MSSAVMRVAKGLLLSAAVLGLIGAVAPAAAAAAEDTPEAGRPMVDPDRDGVAGEELSILARAREYNRRHGITGTDAIPRLVERARYGLARGREEAAEKALAGTGWINLGPVNGAGRCVAVAPHPSIPGTLLVGSAGGGVWKTVDDGASWYPLTDDLPDLSVGAVAYAPSDPEVVYAGTGEGLLATTPGAGLAGGDFIPGIGLLRSDDGGAGWVLLDGSVDVLGISIYAISVHPQRPDEVLVASTNGLYGSTDGGATWQELIGGATVSELVRSATDPDLLYVSIRCGAACPDGLARIMRSEDGGTTWQAAVDGLPALTSDASRNRTSLAAAPSNDQILYAGFNIDGTATGYFQSGLPIAVIYRSDDGGRSWTSTADPGPYLWSQGWYDNDITVNPENPDIVVAAGTVYVRSTDGGASWQLRDPYASSSPTLPHVDGHHLAWQGDTLWLGCDGGVWRSLDDGDTWEARNDGLVTRQFYGLAVDPSRPERVLAGAQDNGTSLRRDAGDDTWDAVLGADGMESAISWLLPDLLFATTQFGSIYRNDRGGEGSWSNVSPPADADDAATFVTPLRARQGTPWVLYTGTSRLWRSDDAGDSWLQLPTETDRFAWTGSEIETIAVSETDPGRVAVAKGAVVYATSDGGRLWHVAPLSNTVNAVAFSPFDGDLMLAGTSDLFSGTGSLRRSTDGGLTWHTATDGLPPFPVQAVAWDPTDADVAYAGTDLGLYRSTDAGLSWLPVGDGLPAASVHAIEITPDGSMLRVATHGRGVWELDLGRPASTPPTVEITGVSGPAVRGSVGDVVTVGATASDPDGDPLTVRWLTTDTWREVGRASGVGAVDATLDLELVSGGLYRLAAVATDSHGLGAADMVRVLATDPADGCAAPRVLAAAGPFPLEAVTTTSFAGVGSDDPTVTCAATGSDPDAGRYGSTWFELTPEESGTYTISSCGSAPDTVLSVWTGPACGPYTAVAAGCNDDGADPVCAGDVSNSYLELELEAGLRYRIMAGGARSDRRGRLRLTVDCASCGATPGRTYLLPAAAHAAGLNGTTWLTDLGLYNPGDAEVTAQLTFQPRGGDAGGGTAATVVIPAGEARELDDVVATVLGTSGSGALRIAADGRLTVSSRTYNTATDGTFGQAIGGVGIGAGLAPGESARLVGLVQGGGFHTNLGLANAGPATGLAAVELYDADGSLLTTLEVELAPHGWEQLNEVFAHQGFAAVAHGSIVVRNTSAATLLTPYASVVDDVTGDPSYVAPAAAIAAGQVGWIAAAAHGEGAAGSVWRTDLDLVNLGDGDATVTVELLRTGEGGAAPPQATIPVAAGTAVRLADVVGSSLGVDGSGALRLTVDGAAVAAASRTYNLGGAGTFGQSIPAVPAAAALLADQRATVIQLRGGDRYRTNLGAVNLTGTPITVVARLYDVDGAPVGERRFALGPFEPLQLNRVLPAEVATGFAVFESRTEGARYLAYASVIDGLSNDPSYLGAVGE